MSGGDLVNNFRNFVAREDLMRPHDQLLLAASAGIDSTVLAYLLKEEGYSFSIVHCNFQLRDEESLADEVFVRELAQRLDVRFFGKRFDIYKDRAAGESTQMVARRLRYLYFKEILEEYNYACLVTAHHLNDSFETMMLNLIRGTGLAGLRGIDPRTDFVTVRPLLEATKNQIRSYAASRTITWREDRSNGSDDYARNRIRHRLIPQFTDSFGMSPEGLASTLSNLRSAHRIFEHGLSLAANPSLTRQAGGFRFDRLTGHWGTVDTITLLRYHTSFMGFTQEQYRQMLSANGHLMLYTEHYVAQVSKERIEFIRQESFQKEELTIRELPFTLPLPDRTLHIELVISPEKLTAPDTLYCSFPGYPLHLRPRRAGDRFQPLGMKGSKKVKDFLIDEKVAPWTRQHARLLTDAEGAVVAVVPFRIDDRFAVRGLEQQVLCIRWERKNPGPQ